MRRDALLAWALTLAAALWSPTAATAADRAKPVAFMLDLGAHTAAIPRLAVHEARGFVVTGSADRSLRFWNLEDGTAYGVRRPPLGDGRVGEITALETLKSGTTLFAAGSSDPDKPASAVYLVDPRYGRIRGPLAYFPGTVSHLAFNDEDGFLAVVGGYDGAWVLDRKRRKVLEEPPGGEAYVWAAFGPDRLLAFGTEGGRIEIHRLSVEGGEAAAEPVAAFRTAEGLTPMSFAFSPDGRELAVGYADAAHVDVYDWAAGGRARRLTAANVVAGQGANLGLVAWAQDEAGRSTLYAGGTLLAEPGRNAVVAWSEGQGGGFATAVARDSLTHLSPLGDGGLVFASTFPSWGRLAPPPAEEGAVAQGRGAPAGLLYAKSVPKLDFRYAAQSGRFAVSPDGATVALVPNPAPGEPRRALAFDLTGPSLQALPDAELDPGYHLPAPTRGALSVADWYARTEPRIGGRAPSDAAGGPLLTPGERSLSVDVALDGSRVLLGTDYALNLLDPAGREIARRSLPAAAWAVALVPERPLAVAALGDGTLRWYSLREDSLLEEIAAVFVADDLLRWIAWRPDGYFDHAPLGGADLAGYNLRRERRDEAGKVLDLAGRWQSLAGLYRARHDSSAIAGLLGAPERWHEVVSPDALTGLLAELGRPEVRLLALCPADEPDSPACLDLTADRGAPGAPLTAAWEADAEVELTFRLDEGEGPLTAVQLYRDGSFAGRVVREELATETQADGSLVATLPLELTAGEVALALRLYGAGEAYHELPVATLSLPPERTPSVLYVLAVGVADYANDAFDLNSPVVDAAAVTAQLHDLVADAYDDVAEPVLLADADATRENILREIGRLAELADGNDGVVLYFAGHGEASEAGYAFVTYDVTSLDTLWSDGLVDRDLIDAVGRLKSASLLMLLDTCYAGAFDQKASDQLAHDLQHYVLTATGSDETALDTAPGSRYGLFVDSFLRGTAREAALSSGEVTALSLGSFMTVDVKDLAARANHKQSVVFRGGSGHLRHLPLTTAPESDR